MDNKSPAKKFIGFSDSIFKPLVEISIVKAENFSFGFFEIEKKDRHFVQKTIFLAFVIYFTFYNVQFTLNA